MISSYPLKGDPLENFTVIDFLKELKSRGSRGSPDEQTYMKYFLKFADIVFHAVVASKTLDIEVPQATKKAMKELLNFTLQKEEHRSPLQELLEKRGKDLLISHASEPDV